MAEVLVRGYANSEAAIWNAAASDLEQYEREHALELLTLQQGADESGYSAAHVGRLVAEGKLDNYGEKGSPRIRRGDLPKKRSARSTDQPKTPNGDPDLAAVVLRNNGRT
jgi:hypothetical protein